MTQEELDEIAEGKKWHDNLIAQAKNVHIPENFIYLKRRIHQLRCALFQTGKYVKPEHWKMILRYILGLGFISNLLFKSLLAKDKIKTSFSIWDSDIDPHVSAETFDEFIISKQIISLDKEPFVFAKSGKNRKRFSNSFYTPNPIYDILTFIDITLLDCIWVILSMVKNFFIYLRISLLCQGSEGLFKDFLIEPLIKLYSKKGLVKFYRTNSDINEQQFWCENIDYNTIWYSINTRAIQYTDSPLGPYPEYPFFYFMYNGTSWTWNRTHESWLKKINSHRSHKVNVVGPIIFYSPSSWSKTTRNVKRVLIFDIAPYYPDHIKAHISQRGINYYNEKSCLKFITDIVQASKNEEWEIFLKPKRQYSSQNTENYIVFLRQMESANSNFKILPYTSNVFDEILKSDSIISIPFSSPFDIAKSLNIPAIYYDPSGDVDFKGMGYIENEYANTISSLKVLINK